MPLAELRRAYYRYLRSLPRGRNEDPAVSLLLHRYVPAGELLEQAWEVAGEVARGQVRKGHALHLVLQWALRTLEVGV